ncbi:hypothetical protein [Isoptericola hypogeus]|uniref:hypothetical protein n=1 Tax=Isoptericola hypogeus TaxID=300179 RepID=UPI0031D1BBF5
MRSDPYFGIEGYKPAWQRGLRSIQARHGRRLASLVGRRLTHAWLLWDRENDEWFADAPVLLDLDGEQLEIQHQKFDDLSLTWSTVDPFASVAYPEFDLVWRTGAVPDLARLEGQHLRDITLLEWQGGDMADGMVAVHLCFDDGQLAVYNALDENGVSFDRPSRQYVTHRIASRTRSGRRVELHEHPLQP